MIIMIMITGLAPVTLPARAADNNNQTATARTDVTINDWLDTDTAAVTNMKLTNMTTGTGPFDDNDQPGNDSSPTNKIVRSYDEIYYDWDVTVTPDNTMAYYKNARIGFTFTIPVTTDKATWDLNSLSWADKTPGYAPKATVNPDGTQTLTAYRLLAPVNNTTPVVPGTLAIELPVKTLAMRNGETLAPTVAGWVAWNKTNPTDHGKHTVYQTTVPVVTVSARMSMNVRINQSAPIPGNYDWSTGNATAWNKDKGKGRGFMIFLQSVVEMRWPDRSKGLKGLQAPVGAISYTIKPASSWRDDDSKTPHAHDPRWDPLLWDAANKMNANQNDKGPESKAERPRYQENDGWGPLACSRNANYYYRCAKNSIDHANYTLNQDGSVTTTFDDYDATAFPRGTASGQYSPENGNNLPKCSTRFMDDSCSVIQVGALHSDTFWFVVPAEADGKTIEEWYGNHNQHLDVNVNEYGLTMDGLQPAASNSNSNQAIANDDWTQSSANNHVNGWFQQQSNYSWSGSHRPNGSDAIETSANGNWATAAAQHGQDLVFQGEPIQIGGGAKLMIDDNKHAPVMGISLTKIDPTVLEPEITGDTKVNWTIVSCFEWGATCKMGHGANSTDVTRSMIVWATKPDGTSWTSDAEQAATGIDDLKYWPTVAEAEHHGVIIGAAILVSRGIDPANTYWRKMIAVGGGMPFKVKTTAKPGSVAQEIGETAWWTRSDLASVSGLSVNAPQSEWDAWVKNNSSISKMLALRANGVKATDVYSGKNYKKATFDAYGVYKGGDTADDILGDSLYVASEIPRVSKTIDQNGEDGKTKTTFDLDKNQRQVDYKLTMAATVTGNYTGDRSPYTTDFMLKDVLPKGLSYKPGSSVVGGAIDQATGLVTGGKKIEPSVTQLVDGSTVLEWTVPDVRIDSDKNTLLYYSAIIGDDSDASKDVANNAVLSNTVEIRSRRAQGKPLVEFGQTASASIKISRLHATALSTRSTPLLADAGSKLGFSSVVTNYAKSQRAGALAVDVLPNNGGQSSYHGSPSLTRVMLAGKNGASLDSVTVFVTNDETVRAMDASKITLDMIHTWTKASMDVMTGLVTLPAGYDTWPVAIGFDLGTMPAESSYVMAMNYTPNGNRAGDVFKNTWSDGSNKVTALEQIVDRTVSGVAWIDRDHDGRRGENDDLEAGVTVRLVDSTGKTVTGLYGLPLVTVTTGKLVDGVNYKLTGVPAGNGYKLVFEPRSAKQWANYKTTVRKAAGTTVDTDSDSTGVYDKDKKLVRSTIDLASFPEAGSMVTSVWSDEHEDNGIAYNGMAVFPVTGEQSVIRLALIIVSMISLLALVLVVRLHLYTKR